MEPHKIASEIARPSSYPDYRSPQMTKKDYDHIAAALASTRPEPHTPEYLLWNKTAIAVAQALTGTNPRFDRERFLAACVANTTPRAA